jgi:hypothetical protein
MSGNIYVILNCEENSQLDERFVKSEKNYIFYLVNKNVPDFLKDKKVILEPNIDPVLSEAGKNYFKEWSFFLMEEKHAFCEYPFFVISPRFYQKNTWLLNSLDFYWDDLFKLIKNYGFGYLPSYDRPLRWISLKSWKRKIKRKEWEYRFFPFNWNTFNLTEEIFGLNLIKDVKHISDFFCNYIGFNSRKDLMKYINYYKPLIKFFFDDEYKLKTELTKYIKPNVHQGHNPKEKIFTYFLELLSHLYFFKNNTKVLGLHYNGFYEIDERNKKMKKLKPFNNSIKLQIKRYFKWQKIRIKEESYLPIFISKIKKILNFFIYIFFNKESI